MRQAVPGEVWYFCSRRVLLGEFSELITRVIRLTVHIRIAAWSGCMITILSLVFSTFTQQLISIELVPMSNDTSPGNIPRSETYTGGLPEYLYNRKHLLDHIESSADTV